MKKNKEKDYVIILSKDKTIHKLPADGFQDKLKPIYKQYDAEYLLFEAGASTPIYIAIKRKDALKSFHPFTIRYEVLSVSSKAVVQYAHSFYADNKSVNKVELAIDTYPKFVAFLTSINTMYAIPYLTTKLDTFNDVNMDFEVYNRRLAIGSMEIYNGMQTCVSRFNIHYEISDIIDFLASSLDITPEILLNHSVANSLQNQFGNKSNNRSFIRLKMNTMTWDIIGNEDELVDSVDGNLSHNDLIGTYGLYSTGLVFVSGYEINMLCLLMTWGGKFKLCVYGRPSGQEFDEPNTDDPIDIDYIISHPEEFFVYSLCNNDFNTAMDAISVVSLCKEIAMSQSIILENSGITNAEIMINIILEGLGDSSEDIGITFDSTDLLYSNVGILNKFFELIHAAVF